LAALLGYHPVTATGTELALLLIGDAIISTAGAEEINILGQWHKIQTMHQSVKTPSSGTVTE
jgi:hypothetical protein